MPRILWVLRQGRWLLLALSACAAGAYVLLQGGAAEGGRTRPQERAILYQPPSGCDESRVNDLIILTVGDLLTSYTFVEGDCIEMPQWLAEVAGTCCMADTDLCARMVRVEELPVRDCVVIHQLF